MVYECEKCTAPLPPGVLSCPQCGDRFENAVPYDAEEPPRSTSLSPALPKAQPRRTVKKRYYALAAVVAIVLIAWLSGHSTPSQEVQAAPGQKSSADTQSATPQAKPAQDAPPIYTLDSSNDCTVDQDKPCRRISITVPKGQSRAQIASALTHVAQDAGSQYGTVRGIAFAYAEGTDTNGSYSAGRAEWGPDELTDKVCTADAPQIDYVDDYFKPEAAAPASIKRIPEERRKQIYYEIGLSEDKAQHDADAAYPTNVAPENESVEHEAQAQRNVMPNATLNSALTEKYHGRVRRRYRLTESQFSDILGEGEGKHWPSPDPTKD